MRLYGFRLLATATLLVLPGLHGAPAAAASPRPMFQLPFRCGEQWEAATRPDHDPIEKVDFFKVGGVTNGAPVLASYHGRVSEAGHESGPGYFVTIDHGGGWKTKYYHMIEPPIVKVGATVVIGQQLGNVGSTGDSSAPHLHYEQRHDNVITQTYFNGHRTTVTPGRAQRLTSRNCGAPAAASPEAGPTTNLKRSVSGDRDGDGKTDLAIFRPANGTWLITPSSGGTEQVIPYGLPGDRPVPGDYDGDRKMDLAVYRPSEGQWYILQSAGTRQRTVVFGRAADVPAPGDYNGDGKTDLAFFSPAEGTWYIGARGEPMQQRPHGFWSDNLVQADYDGDGKTDLAVFRPSEGNWYIAPSGGGPALVHRHGLSGDNPVPADYDGDGKTDLAVFRPAEGKWYISPSDGSGERVHAYGYRTDEPMPGDYDGDGMADLAFFRPSEGKLYVLPSSGAERQAA